ncbi:hypothetical protein AMTRI_Chr03g143930 [Amborella trichopoda]
MNALHFLSFFQIFLVIEIINSSPIKPKPECLECIPTLWGNCRMRMRTSSIFKFSIHNSVTVHGKLTCIHCREIGK